MKNTYTNEPSRSAALAGALNRPGIEILRYGLVIVVAGGGFAGVETIGSMNDLLKEALPYYPNLRPEMIRVVLVHPEEFVLTELGRYATRKLAEPEEFQPFDLQALRNSADNKPNRPSSRREAYAPQTV
jgi:hypothetical protein